MADLEWSSNTDWTNAQSTENIDINSGTFELADAIPDSGVSRWEFEQDVTDSWDENDGNDNTSAGYVSGQFGDAKGFDGADGYVEIPSASNITGLQEFSVSFWVNFDSKADFTGVAGKGTDISNPDGAEWLFTLDASADQLIRIGVSDGSTRTFAPSTTAPPTGSYTHVVGTFASNTLRIYINGAEENSVSHTGNGVHDEGGRIGLGASADGDGYGNYMDGSLDRFDIYNKELSSSEVSNLYSTGDI